MGRIAKKQREPAEKCPEGDWAMFDAGCWIDINLLNQQSNSLMLSTLGKLKRYFFYHRGTEFPRSSTELDFDSVELCVNSVKLRG
jgi:hypothetical protein